ncbi:uncharacterized protein VP01_2257g2 [Puccinia sorghi]|uniref:Uncharacterized protein n=1 Tax=Puccinia sorghi TaxID=27349 RepID=A0A0L6V8E4_9BASI|nr:uncharacterized protein VP01_2257g2 [Puccinia sorghi]
MAIHSVLNDSYACHLVLFLPHPQRLYDGILGMPWLRRNGHLIDWTNYSFLPSVAAVYTAL